MSEFDNVSERLEAMEQRLEALHAQNARLAVHNRWLRRLGGVVLVVAFVAVIFAQGERLEAQAAKAKIVDAEEIILRDPAGKTRVKLGVEKDGSAGVHG